MRTVCACAILALIAAGLDDPERLLSERFQFTPAQLAQARQGQPIVKVKAQGKELNVLGAIRLPGKKERLSAWVRNIDAFRRAAELGNAHVIPSPPTAAAFAQADDAFRTPLLEHATAYVSRGDSREDMRALIGKAATLTDLAPELVAYLDRFPAAQLTGADQTLYWSSTAAGSDSVVSLHHLIVYPGRSGEIWIADKNLYASKYFDAGVLVIGLYDAKDGQGFYAVAGSRLKSSQLGGKMATVLRSQVQRVAADNVKTYLEWLRDSLAMATLAPVP